MLPQWAQDLLDPSVCRIVWIPLERRKTIVKAEMTTMHTLNTEIRIRIDELCKTDEDLDRFLLDYFRKLKSNSPQA